MHAPSDGHHQKITLLQERSAGTFARVYLAEAVDRDGLSRIVAVKVLKEQWAESEELLTRTRDEARLLARLRHKNILRVEALAQVNGQPAIVMEFVDGLDLKQLIEVLHQRGGRIPPRATFKIAQHTASALQAAAEDIPYGRSEPLNVVHRDIKPSNIMLSKDGEVKVLDFGTARFTHESRLARTGVMRFGSMKYMSPERRIGDRGERPSDVYSLGLVIIEVLRGELLPLLPLDRAEHDRFIEESIAQLDHLDLPNAAWEDSLRQTISRMCAFDPAMRLRTNQVTDLMRAFSEQATGASLETFANDQVREVADDLYGESDTGDLTGSQVFVALSTSSNSPIPSAPPPTSSPATPDPATPDPAEPVALQPVEPSPQPAVLQPSPVAPQPVPIAIAGVQDEPPPPEATPDTPSNRKRVFLLAGLAGAVLLLALVAVIAAAGVYLFMKPPSPPPAPEPSQADVLSADTVTVHVGAEDDGVQWIKLTDLDGQRVLKGTPDGDAELEPGDYQLSAKLVGRSAVQAQLPISASVSLHCEPQPKGQVLCRTADGATELLLTP